ncbi:MAG: polyphenol oxidase family protein [Gemmatimonadota bacterium]|nr:polyphenol oxidase family protein [Gemmatimonadota bacterium]
MKPAESVRDRDPALAAEELAGLEVTERRRGPVLRLESWESRYRGLVCGITRAAGGDYGVAGAAVGGLLDGWGDLAASLGFGGVSVPLQVHGRDVVRVGRREAARADGAPATILLLPGRVDGHVTTTPGLLLGATAADCVPVYALDPGAGAWGLAHAGWRGVAAGVLEVLRDRMIDAGAGGPEMLLHLGPAICGPCYEVDEPVLEALGLPGDRARVDLRGLLVRQALEAGFSRERISTSALCTRCGPAGLHSYRRDGTRSGRMAAFLGMREESVSP